MCSSCEEPAENNIWVDFYVKGMQELLSYVPFTCKFSYLVMHFVLVLHKYCGSKSNYDFIIRQSSDGMYYGMIPVLPLRWRFAVKLNLRL